MSRNFVWISDSSHAPVNMARDEWLLDHVNKDDVILHIYTNAPSVIIGKNQNPWVECDTEAMKKDGVVLARRISGGGAVYHDEGNLNFSFVCGCSSFDKKMLLDLVLQALRSLGISCEPSGRNDLLVAGKKCSGTALCDRKGNKLFHGTLLLSSDLDRLSRYLTVDPKKIRSKGIASVRARVCNLAEHSPGLTLKQLQKALLASFETLGYYGEFALCAEEEKQLEELVAKHASSAWTFGTTPRFDKSWEERLPFGSVSLCLSFEKGIISRAQAFSDAMDAAFCPAVEAALTDVPYDPAAVKKALLASPHQDVQSLAEYSIV